MPVSSKQIVALVESHMPVKARQLTRILKDEFGLSIDNSTMNKKLYALEHRGIVIKNDNFEWSVVSAANDERMDAKRKSPEIIFTRDQQAVIDLDPSGHLLIRGQAGSGKTTVLAARAGKIISSLNQGSLLFLTYNSALAASVKLDLEKGRNINNVKVSTFHEWAREASEALGASVSKWVNGKQRKEVLKALIQVAIDEQGQHRLYDLEDSTLLDWYGDEIAWLFGQYVTKLKDYQVVERVGRGTVRRLRRDEREFVWTVFELYEEWLEENNSADYDNPAGLVLRTLMQYGGGFPEALKIDHVMIDEVQDFDKSWLLAVMPAVKVSLAVAGDLAQRIYKRNFNWSSVGISVQGARSKTLVSSFRSTRQVLMVAEYLLRGNDIKQVSDYVPPTFSEKQGPKVYRHTADDSKSAYVAAYDWIAKTFGDASSGTVVVAVPFSNQAYPAKNQLEERGLDVSAARGKSLGQSQTRIVTTTYHQLKGLEFDHVVMVGLNDNQFPGRLLKPLESARLESDDIKLEHDRLRRLIYVAMTRSRQTTALFGSGPFCRFFSDVPAWLFEDL